MTTAIVMLSLTVNLLLAKSTDECTDKSSIVFEIIGYPLTEELAKVAL